MSSDVPTRRAGDLSPEKLALLVMRMKKKKDAEAQQGAGGAIPRRPAGGPLPLSFAQQRLWLLDRLEPGTSAYNMPSPARLLGSLDRGVLARALNEILCRHESLRTRFTAFDGVPVQVIEPPAETALPMADLSGLPRPAAREEGDRLLAAEAKAPFDVERGPLGRFLLVRLDPAEHLLLVDLHHIVSDGWSMGLFFHELSVLYEAFLGGRPSPLPELPIQYADFAVWQREWLQGTVLEEHLAYWRNQLAGSPPALELPTDRLRPAVQSHRGESLRVEIPETLTLALRELTRREGASLFMTLLAGFYVLLSRLSGQEDVVVGSPSAGRRRVETEGLIGLFLNTLVLRADLSGAPSFNDLLARVKTTVLDAYRYQEVPFEKLLEELQPERVLSRTPVFQVLFNMVSVPPAVLAMPGLQIEPIAVPEPDAKFDFTFYLQERGEAVHINLVYNADLFERYRMEELLRQFEGILSQAAAAPGGSIGALSLVTPAARALLPDPAAPLSSEWMGSVHGALERGAARFPERPAVVGWGEGEVWTYGELDARSNQLARFLRAGGAGKEDVVALWAHRGASLAWAILGTLKAGAAFMILDPAYPSARLAEYLAIGRPKAWLAVAGAPAPPAEVAAALPALGLELPALPDIPADFLAGFPAADPDVPVGPGDAACVTFTSGSTGRPKGVVGLHGALSHFYPWMGRQFGLSESDRFSMLSALPHDPLQRDVFAPLWFGATLCVPEPDRLDAPGYLAEWIRRHEVSVLHLTPAMMELVTLAAEEEEERDLPSLRYAFVVGDLLKKSEVARLQRLAPGLACINLYGATETQRALSWFAVPRPEAPEAARLGREVLPLGRGMEGCQLLVLNRASGLAGVGELGEIHIRSHHLARGYLDDEALTAQRFLANPFSHSGSPGDRLYRTGDLGRYLPGGSVELAGRADFQVKLRGFRIELGEVEAALSRFPGVRECVAVIREDKLREDRPGEKLLVAYLAAAGSAPEARGLRAFLGERLPDYMVPSAFVVLAALPLTATGKVDRLALPAPGQPAETGEGAAPRNRVEEILAAVWAEVLRRGQVGIHDNFFALGGDSIRTIQVVSRCRKHGLRLAPRQLFQYQTIAELAEVAEIESTGQEHATGGPLPFTPAQRRLLAGPERLRVGVRIDLPAGFDAAAVRQRLDALAARHDALRLRFEAGVQRLAPAGTPAGEAAIPLERLPAVSPAEALGRLQGGAEALRTALLDGSPAVLVLAAHPLALDAPSWGLLLADFFAAGTLADSVPFARWAEALAAEGPEPAPPKTDVAPALSVPAFLAEAETASLLGEALEAYGNKVEELLLAAVAGALAVPRLVAEVEGLRPVREGLDASRTIGCLAAPVYVETGLQRDPGDALKEVKERLRRALRQAGGAAAGEPGVTLRWLAPLAGRAGFIVVPEAEARRLRVDCRLEGGRLRADWTSRGIHRREDLERLAGRFVQALEELVRHCQSPQSGGFTPSDFPVSGLDQADLDQLLAELG